MRKMGGVPRSLTGSPRMCELENAVKRAAQSSITSAAAQAARQKLNSLWIKNTIQHYWHQTTSILHPLPSPSCALRRLLLAFDWSMARRGVWQLEKLVVQYCDWSGSSTGTRQFLRDLLPRFRQENPQLHVEEVMRRGGHPSIVGSYKNGNSRAVSLRNAAPEEALRQAVLLRSGTGRKALPTKQRTKTQEPSVQGAWTPELQASLSVAEAP